MNRTMMKGKIHRATVTDANLAYEGSITLDPVLMELADILPHEQVHVYDVDNGNRLITYAIEGTPGDGGVCLNGAAARLVQPGDRVIIVSYSDMDDAEAKRWVPKVVRVDERNRPLPEIHPERAAG
jgi:aspartate 1-decarboxylase